MDSELDPRDFEDRPDPNCKLCHGMGQVDFGWGWVECICCDPWWWYKQGKDDGDE